MKVGEIVSFGRLHGRVVFVDPEERTADVRIWEKVTMDVPVEWLEVKKAGCSHNRPFSQTYQPASEEG